MTKISYIQALPKDEWAGRATIAAAQKRVFLPVPSMTRGQLRLELTKRIVERRMAAYPELRGELTAALALIDRAMQGQSASAAFSTFRVSPLTTEVAREVREAIRLMGQPAMGGWRDPLDNHVGEVPKSLVYDYPKLDIEYNLWKKKFPGYRVPKFDVAKAERHYWAKLLDEKWSSAGHHTLYEFVVNPNQRPSAVAVKTTLHKIATSSIANQTTIDRVDLRLWQRDNIEAVNVKNGSLATPEESIDALKEVSRPRIGCPICPFIVPIIIAAAKAASMIIAAVKAKDPATSLGDEIKGYGLPDYGPETKDWDGDGIPNDQDPTPNGSSNNNLLLLGGAAVAAVFLLKDKK